MSRFKQSVSASGSYFESKTSIGDHLKVASEPRVGLLFLFFSSLPIPTWETTGPSLPPSFSTPHVCWETGNSGVSAVTSGWALDTHKVGIELAHRFIPDETVPFFSISSSTHTTQQTSSHIVTSSSGRSVLGLLLCNMFDSAFATGCTSENFRLIH